MWKLIDKLSGQIYENKMKLMIISLGSEIIEDYKRSGINTYIQYKGNNVFELKKIEYKENN